MTDDSSQSAANARSMFSPRQIYTAAFLGTPLAAAWLFRANFLATGDPRRASSSLWLGSLLLLFILAIAFALPDRTPRILVPLLYSVALYWYAMSLFSKPFAAHLDSGGAKGSWWTVIGASVVATLMLFVAALIAVVIAQTLGLVPTQ